MTREGRVYNVKDHAQESHKCTNEAFLSFVREAHRRAQDITEEKRERVSAFLREHPEANAVLLDKDGSMKPLKFVPVA